MQPSRPARLLLPLVVTASLAAQGGVSPPYCEQHWGNTTHILYPTGYTDLRFQQLIERTSLPATMTTGKQIKAIGFRRNAAGAPHKAVKLNHEISMWSTWLPVGSMTTDFAANRKGGKGGVALARKNVNLPPLAHKNPRDFVMVPFDRPHTHTGGRILLEFSSVDTSSRWTGWRADHTGSDGKGRSNVIGSKCGAGTNAIGIRDLSGNPLVYLPGNRIEISQTGGPKSQPAILLLGASVLNAGGLPLPFDLGPAGAPGCTLYTSFELQLPTRLDSSGVGFHSYVLPNNPTLSGQMIYHQWTNVEPRVNALNVSMSACRWLQIGPIGSGPLRIQSNTTWAQSSAATKGTRTFRNRMLVVRFDY